MKLTPLKMLILAVAIAGIGPVLVRESPVGPAATAFWRLAIALPLAAWMVGDSWRLARADAIFALCAGLLLAADLVLWNNAILRTSVMEATVLVMLFPILVAAGEIILFGRRLDRRLLVGGLIAFVGTSLLALGAAGGQSDIAGDLMALAAAVLYAASLLISAQLCRRNNTQSITLWLILGAVLGALPAGLVEGSYVPRGIYDWLYLFSYGILTFASYALYNSALGKLPTSLVAISSYGQPVIATILAGVLLHEIPTVHDLLGGAIIILGLAIATARFSNRSALQAKQAGPGAEPMD